MEVLVELCYLFHIKVIKSPNGIWLLYIKIICFEQVVRVWDDML